MRKLLERFVAASLAMLLVGGTARATSTINPSVPAQSSPLTSAPVRSNFAAAYADVNGIESMFFGSTAPVNPSINQFWANNSTTPYQISMWDGSQWVSFGVLNPTTHVFIPNFAAPVVGSTVALRATATSTFPNGVWRLDAAGNNAPPLFFKDGTGPCALDDGASCVNSSDGKSWLGQFINGQIDVRQFGVFTNLTNPSGNASEMNTALNYAASISTKSYPIVTCGGNTVAIEQTVHVHGLGVLVTNCSLVPFGTPAWVAGAGSTQSHVFYKAIDGIVTGTVWVPPDPFIGTPPIGMVSIDPGSFNVSLQYMTISCNYQVGCADITNYGGTTTLDHLHLQKFYTYGLFSASNWVMTNSTINEQGNAAVNWTGYGLYCAGGGVNGVTQPIDNITNSTVISQSYQEFYDDSNCQDFKFVGSHAWSGSDTSFAGTAAEPVSNGIIGTIHGGGAVVTSDTFDVGAIIILTTSASLPPVTIGNNLYENNGALYPANIILQCDQLSSTCGNNSSQVNTPVTFQSVVSRTPNTNISYLPITLMDVSGNYYPGAWSTLVQALVGNGNNLSSSSFPMTNNILEQATPSPFTATATNLSNQLTGVSIFPPPGTTVTDTGGCLTTGTVLIGMNWAGTPRLTLSSPSPPTSCPFDTFNVGTLTVTGGINAGSYETTALTGVNFAGLSTGVLITDSANCIPPDSWLSGYNLTTGVIIFDNEDGTGNSTEPATCTHAGDTITLTSTTYYPKPADSNANLLVSNGGTPITIGVRADLFTGWNLNLDFHGNPNTVTMHLLGGTTLNGFGSDVVVPDTNDEVDTLWSSRSAATKLFTMKFHLPINSTVAGLSAWPCTTDISGEKRYITDQNGVPSYRGALTGGGSNVTLAVCLGTSPSAGNWVAD